MTQGEGVTGAAAASTQRLKELIEEATVDCHSEEEQATGLFTMIEKTSCCPFKTTVLGIGTDVVSIDMGDDGQLVAVCTVGKHGQRIALADLALPSRLPEGAEWIAAYRLWASGGEVDPRTCVHATFQQRFA